MTQAAPTRRAPRRPWRTTVAVTVGAAAAALSRTVTRGRGTVIGGRVALVIDPHVLGRVTLDRAVTIVTGTNGKTTTTRLVASALGAEREVTSTNGANMPAGLVASAAADGEETVLEVDELYVPRVLTETRAAVLVLLNISRDQLDRIVEIRRIAELWRRAIGAVTWPLTVVANADDPLVVWAVGDHPGTVWVAAGSRWRQDSTLCPACGKVREIGENGAWSCTCGLARPAPSWHLDGEILVGPDVRREFHPALPGAMNRANAAMAVAVAAVRGVDPAKAIEAIEHVDQVAGRYRSTDVDGRDVRLLLAKNPASWTETLGILEASADPIVICVNARGADGQDTSWLWDVPFERLAGRVVAASGERHWDIALRLQTAGVDCIVDGDPSAAVRAVAEVGERVELVATYTAFHQILKRLGVKW